MLVAKVNNLPTYELDEWVVARFDGLELWFYGTYDDESDAIQVATEIGNGLVLHKVNEWNPAFGEKV